MTKKFSLAIFSLFFLVLSAEAKLYVFGIENDEKPGDRSHVRGIRNQLLAQCTDGDYTCVPINGDISAVISQALSEADRGQDQAIVVASGVEGVNALERLSAFRQTAPIPTTFVHSSHMLTPNHDRLIDVADIIAVPSHAEGVFNFGEKLERSRTSLVTPTGVPHDLTTEDIVDALYNEKKAREPSFPTDRKKYILVILPGDAPNGQTQQLYGESEAQRLAEYIGKKVGESGAHLLITNGPRTGKHEPGTLEARDWVHRKSAHDPVTDAFMAVVGEKLSKDQFSLVGFQYGTESKMAALFGAILLNEGSEIFAPGESTTQVSQSIDVVREFGNQTLPAEEKGRVVIVRNGAMNASHMAHMESELKTGRASVVEWIEGQGWKMHEPARQPAFSGQVAGSSDAHEKTEMPTQPSAAKLIAFEVLKKVGRGVTQ